MNELERRLRHLGQSIDFPATPDLAAAVEVRLSLTPRRRRRIRGRALAIAFAIFVLGVGTAFAVPGSREAILEWLGLRGATIERVVTLPEVAERPELALGERVTLDEARRQVAFDSVVPRLLGEPDQIYVDESAPGGRVSLVYLGEDGEIAALVTEFRGDLAPELIGKLLAGGTTAEEVTVDGQPGVWIQGEPHVFFYRDPNGDIREETLRLAGNTLLWQRGDLLLRLESGLAKAEALRVATSASSGADSRSG
jgi:hypothetical protein